MKRFFALLLCMLLLVCGGALGEGAALDTSTPVTLRLVGPLENFEGMEAVIAAFELQYPNCTVEYEMLNDYGSTILPRIQNDGTETQLFMAQRSNYQSAPELLDYALDLSTAGIDMSALNQKLTDSMLFDGRLCGIPLGMDVSGMIVNKSLLAAHGVAMPTNIDELCAVAEKLQAEGVTPFRCQFSQFALRLLYPLVVNDIVHSATYETDMARINAYEAGTGELFRDAFERIVRLRDAAGLVFDKELEFADNYNDTIMAFLEGNVAFAPCTTETMSGTKKREARSEAFTAAPFEYEFCFAPVGDDGVYGYMQPWFSIAINKTAEHQDWALAFVKFLTQEENMSMLASIKGIPSNTANANDPRYASLFTLDDAHMAYALQFVSNTFSPMRSAMTSLIVPGEDGTLRDVQGAVDLYEEEIAKKRAQ